MGFDKRRTLATVLHEHIKTLGNPLDFDWSDSVSIERLRGLGILKGLDTAKQEHLRRLVATLCRTERVVSWKEVAAHRADRARWEKHGPGYVREIIKKAKKAQTALIELRKYSRKIGLRPAAVAPLMTDTIHALHEPPLSEVEDHLTYFVIARKGRTRTGAMRILYRFFAQTCGLTPPEAEIRVARIGNEFWDWQVKAIEQVPRKPDPLGRVRADDTRRGCEAVRKAVRRGKRERGHT